MQSQLSSDSPKKSLMITPEKLFEPIEIILVQEEKWIQEKRKILKKIELEMSKRNTSGKILTVENQMRDNQTTERNNQYNVPKNNAIESGYSTNMANENYDYSNINYNLKTHSNAKHTNSLNSLKFQKDKDPVDKKPDPVIKGSTENFESTKWNYSNIKYSSNTADKPPMSYADALTNEIKRVSSTDDNTKNLIEFMEVDVDVDVTPLDEPKYDNNPSSKNEAYISSTSLQMNAVVKDFFNNDSVKTFNKNDTVFSKTNSKTISNETYTSTKPKAVEMFDEFLNPQKTESRKESPINFDLNLKVQEEEEAVCFL